MPRVVSILFASLVLTTSIQAQKLEVAWQTKLAPS